MAPLEHLFVKDYGLMSTLISRLTLIPFQTVTLISRLAFITQLAGSNVGSNSFFQFLNFQTDFVFVFVHSLSPPSRKLPHPRAAALVLQNMLS